ncbi:RcnB family protein [Robbsia sp. Bb-Pol-6]|uniref:RcnB family protein n=1 Tax=Robbsia betulipollinis TaxID=2981849 RepID=A0ABT3ZRB9_9BURK|nr:RcnB family protein [Robbsia betulipollinis]MCY0389104.1 RcnB family protein [Robbsia betulipollinis]
MKKIISSMLVAAALASSAVYAQQGPDQGHDGNGGHGGGPGQMHGGPGPDHGGPGPMHGGPGMHADRGGPGGWQGGPGGPGGEWRHRGGRLPGDYRDRQYVVDDWRGYNLQPPPRGYHWVGVGGDYLLVAVASGVIAQIITGR